MVVIHLLPYIFICYIRGDYKMKFKVSITIFAIFFIIGVLFVVLANKFEIDESSVGITTATVIDNYIDKQDEGDFYTTLNYFVDDIEYTTDVNYYSSSDYVGDELEIYYDLNNPNKINLVNNNKLLSVFKIVGILCIIVGILCILPDIIAFVIYLFIIIKYRI